MEIEARLEGVVASVDPIALREEIQRLGKLVEHARSLEGREIESKLVKLRKVLSDNNIFNDPTMKLLIFTEHKDTLDYLAGDGKDGRPLGKLRQWNLKTTQIHGGMKIGDRDTPGSRIYAEREFRDDAQILVATEAAGEGINLQFCWFMVNYDIPWNPVRLEQRMGRIHRYGQEHDCLIFNFVAVNTREGRVLAKLLERLLEIRSELGTDQVFDVVGEVFPANLLEKLFREMYVRRMDLSNIEARIVRDVDPERFRKITSSTLEGLAKRELNLGALLGKSAEARERRLIPEVIEDFFVAAGPIAGIHPKPVQKDGHVFRVGKVPRTLQPIGERLEPRFGRLGREYQKIVFDKALLPTDPTLEWVTPGHPLFEVVRDDVAERVRDDLKRGAVFYDLQAEVPVRLDAFAASVKDEALDEPAAGGEKLCAPRKAEDSARAIEDVFHLVRLDGPDNTFLGEPVGGKRIARPMGAEVLGDEQLTVMRAQKVYRAIPSPGKNLVHRCAEEAMRRIRIGRSKIRWIPVLFNWQPNDEHLGAKSAVEV
jgi:hypothetical protein